MVGSGSHSNAQKSFGDRKSSHPRIRPPELLSHISFTLSRRRPLFITRMSSRKLKLGNRRSNSRKIRFSSALSQARIGPWRRVS